MGREPTAGERELAAEVWRLMAEFAFTRFQGTEHVRILREAGLTPGHMKAMSILDPERPKPMRALADSLACDASTVTWLVDRLEERGLVERRASTTDRRVKTVVLTGPGIELRERLGAALFTPPPELTDLDAESLRALRDALARLPLPERTFWPTRDRPDRAEASDLRAG
jgi:DNA-binding MarR family transcriptional regulator